jgi:fumarate reductase flavoprotein subunit
MAIPAMGGILVNRHGQRFVREDIGPSALAPWVMAQPGGVALEVFDSHIEAGLTQHSAYQAALQAGQVMRADDVPTLAALAGVEPMGLQAPLARASGIGSRLGRCSIARTRYRVRPTTCSWLAS